MYLIPITACADNDLSLLPDGNQALVVGPGDAEPALAAPQRNDLQLAPILVTHHHVGGIGATDPYVHGDFALSAAFRPCKNQFK